MGNVKEILNRPAPPILYHYTSQEGLLGIINDKEIWATHTQYLNDVREFRHALDIVRDELSKMQKEPTFGNQGGYLAEMEAALMPGMEGINVCVCSFSEYGDVLSQWRAYGGAASGFAVGFAGDYLREISQQHGWLVPVTYDEGDQRALARTLLQDVLHENQERVPKPDNVPGGNLVAYLYRYAPIFKDKSFREECEWRIVTRPLPCVSERFRYRAGTSMLIPYFRLPLGNDESLGLKEIVIGPTPHPAQSRASLAGLLIKNDIRPITTDDPELTELLNLKVKITDSEVPYRSW